MKWHLMFFMFLLLPIVMADQGEIEIYKPTEVFDLSIHLTNITGEVTGANCQTGIKDENYNTIYNATLNDIGRGWYNGTYNTSATGKYFCTQNCTKGSLFVATTCDFVIKGDTTMPIAVILTVIFVILVYFFLLITIFTQRQFNEHGLIKLLFYMTAFWVLLLPVNMAVQFNNLNGGPVAVTDHLELLYTIMIWLNSFIMFYFILWFIVQLLKKLMMHKEKIRLGQP